MNFPGTTTPKLYLLLFTILLVIVVSAFAMDLDCLLGGCHHHNDSQGPCHIERNLLNSSNSFDNSKSCSASTLPTPEAAFIPDTPAEQFDLETVEKPRQTPALSLYSTRAPPCRPS
jgi:hypothetical protein